MAARSAALGEALKSRKLVIAGDPGSGNTTSLRRLAQECCSPSGDMNLPSGTFPSLISIGELVLANWKNT